MRASGSGQFNWILQGKRRRACPLQRKRCPLGGDGPEPAVGPPELLRPAGDFRDQAAEVAHPRFEHLAHDQLEPGDRRHEVAFVQPAALPSMKMVPPPIITIMKIDIVMEPGSRYCT